MLLSQKRLEIEQTNEVWYFFEHFKILKKIRKNHKFALIFETVRESELDEIMGFHGLSMLTAKYFQHFKNFNNLQKNNLKKTMLNYYGNALFLYTGTKAG